MPDGSTVIKWCRIFFFPSHVLFLPTYPGSRCPQISTHSARVHAAVAAADAMRAQTPETVRHQEGAAPSTPTTEPWHPSGRSHGSLELELEVGGQWGLQHLTATQREQQLRAARTGASTREVSTEKFGDDDDGYHATFVIKVTNPGSSADGVTCLRLTRWMNRWMKDWDRNFFFLIYRFCDFMTSFKGFSLRFVVEMCESAHVIGK